MKRPRHPDSIFATILFSMSAGDPKDKLVLIVEDDDDIRELLTLAIGRAGFRLLEAARGEDGIKQIAHKPHALVLDLIMPGCGGLGVLDYLKSTDTPRPIVLVITAFQDQHPVVMAALRDPNVTLCLRKPIDTDRLLEALHRYLGTERPSKPA